MDFSRLVLRVNLNTPKKIYNFLNILKCIIVIIDNIINTTNGQLVKKDKQEKYDLDVIMIFKIIRIIIK